MIVIVCVNFFIGKAEGFGFAVAVVVRGGGG